MTTPDDWKQIVIAGHSHVAALIGGREWHGYLLPAVISDNARSDDAVDTTGPLLPIQGHERIFGLKGPWPRTAEYWDAFVENAAGRSVALLWEGNHHNGLFLIEQPIPFDFVPRSLASLPVDEDAVIVPEAVIRAKLGPAFNGIRELIARVKKQPDSRAALVGPPPPPILPTKHLNYRLTSSNVRLKLWQVQIDLLREEAEEVGAEFITAPDSVRDAEGFLKPEFWSVDPTHGNVAYGQVMLNELEKRL